jgi:hypothetical protein
VRISIKNDEDLAKLLSALGDEFVKAYSHFRLYRDISDAVSKHAYAMNHSPTFWSMSIQAHLDTALLGLCRIYDQNAKTFNLYNLLDTIKQNLSLFDVENFRQRLKDNPYVESLSQGARKPNEKQLDADLEFASKNNQIVYNLTMWRNNIVAHTSPKNLLQGKDVSGEYPLSNDDIATLLDRGLLILNHYSKLFKASTLLKEMIGQGDYRFVMESIQLRLDEQEKRIQAEIAETLVGDGKQS